MVKLRIVGGPVEAARRCECEVDPNATDWLRVVEEAVGASLAGYVLHATEVEGKKVKAGAALNSSISPSANGLKNGSIVMLKQKTATSGHTTPREASANRSPAPSSAAAAAPPPAERSYRDRVIALYQAYDPSKVGQADSVLAKYPGKEEQVIAQLVKKFGPEPVPEAAPVSAPAPAAPKPVTPTTSAPPVIPKLDIPPPAASPKRTYRERVAALYALYDPSKLNQVDALLAKYQGKEEQVISQLVKKLGPEPEAPGTGSAAPTPHSAAPTPHSAVASPRGTEATPAQPAAVNSPRSHRDRVVAIFQKYDPGKVGQADALLKKHPGKEEGVIASLVKKYGPEPELLNSSMTSPPATPKPVPKRTYHDRVTAMYAKYAPDKLGTVEKTLEKYKGQEEDVMKTLVGKYGPEPTEEELTAAQTPQQHPSSSAPHQTTAPAEKPAPPSAVDSKPPAAELRATHADPVPLASPADKSLDPTPLETPRSEGAGAEPHLTSTLTDTLHSLQIEPSGLQLNLTTRSLPSVPMAPLRRARDWTKPLEYAAEAMAAARRLAFQRAIFLGWQRNTSDRTVQREVAAALQRNEWVSAGDGYHLMDAGSDAVSTTTVSSLEAEYRRRRSGRQFAPPTVQALRQLCLTTGHPIPKGAFVSEDIIRGGLLDATDALRAAREEIEHARHELVHRTENFDHVRHQLEAKLEAACAQVQDAEAKASQFSHLQDEANHAKQSEQRALDALHGSENALRATKEKLARTKKELEDERRGIPTNLEQQLLAKDEQLAKLHQELARTRSSYNQSKNELKEAGEMVERLRVQAAKNAERQRPKSPSPVVPRLPSAPRYFEPTASARMKFSNSSPSSARPESNGNLLASPTNDDAEFQPDEKPSSARHLAVADHDDMMQTATSFDDDAVDVEPLPDRGLCPHCHTALTSFGNEHLDTLGEAEKAAFCFSCRRSFSVRDLRARDQRARSREQILVKYSPNGANRSQRL